MKKKLPLSKTHPKLAKEAFGWDTGAYSYGSAKIVSWKCAKKHVYTTSINSRTNRKSGCPFCANQKVLTGFNDLKKKYPKHAKYAHNFKPESILYGSNQIKEWKCSLGHIWKEKVNWFIKRNPKCKTCSGLVLLSGFNDMKTKFPKIAIEAFDWNPSKVLPNESKKLIWQCKNKHTWPATPAQRTSKGSGCPYCKKGALMPGFNDLKSTFPKLAKEAHLWDPSKVHKGSNLKLEWKCSKGHIFETVVSHRTARGDGCSICSNHKLLVGFNDLLTMFPLIADEAYGWNPKKYKYIDRVNLLTWKCKQKNHEWKSTIADRTRNKRKCPTCFPSKTKTAWGSLSETHPDLAKQAHGWDTTNYSAGSEVRQKWKCKLGHIYESRIYSRVNGSGCTFCSNKSILKGFNDLKTKFPEIAKEAHGWDPATVFPASNKQMYWTCNLGHEYLDSPNHRTGRKTGCSYCSNHKVLIGFNDLDSKNSELASQAFGWDPKTVTIGSNRRKKWRCSEGHIWTAVVASRKNSGCPTCTKYGFDPNLDGFIYFIEQKDWQMVQIGITNYLENRLNSHKKNGWSLIEVRGPMDGHLTQQWETAILRMLKAKGADLSNSKIAGKFDGYSEAWSQSTFRVSTIRELMEKTEEYESN